MNTIILELIKNFTTLLEKIYHQIAVSRSHIRELFEKKFDYIFEDIKFPETTPAETARVRQDSVQPLRHNYKFIYVRDSSGKLTRPFASDYIKRSLYFLLCRKKPRFASVLAKGEHINHHTIAVVCTFVSICFDYLY
jgi:hypothetical protein